MHTVSPLHCNGQNCIGSRKGHKGQFMTATFSDFPALLCPLQQGKSELENKFDKGLTSVMIR
jgi:hypothetical protein